jgi:hypothetical protein
MSECVHTHIVLGSGLGRAARYRGVQLDHVISGSSLPVQAELSALCLWNTHERQARTACGPTQNLRGMSDQWI